MSNLFRQASSQVNWVFILAKETCSGFRQAGGPSLPGPACHLLPGRLVVSRSTWLACSSVSQKYEASVLDRDSSSMGSQASKLEAFGYLLTNTRST